MNRTSAPLVLCLVVFCRGLSGGLDAGEGDSAGVRTLACPGSDASPAAPVHVVTREPIRIDVTLQGVIEAEHMEVVAIDPEAWTQLKVVEAVEHGARVRSGEALVTLETEPLDEAVRDLEREKRLSEISLEQKRVELHHATKTLEMDVRATELSRKEAKENLDHFTKIGRPESEKSAEFMVKKARDYLEYQKEELRQLEKMYGADDLTEETEEIILKRQRDAVELAIFSLERARVSRDQSLGMNLPRQEEEMRSRFARNDLTWEKARASLPMTLERQRLDVAALEHNLEKMAERLEKLRSDRALMTIVARADGIVYYGQFVRGAWSGASVMAKRLEKGGVVPAGEVLMTVVQPRPFVVRGVVPEKELGQLSDGSKGKAIPAAWPDVELRAKIRSLADVPVGPGAFEALVDLEEDGSSPELLPGMTCAVTFTPYENPAALTVPARCVFTDERAQDTSRLRRFVFVVTESGEHERRAVKTGRTVQGKTEILDGLTEGARVLLERPRGE